MTKNWITDFVKQADNLDLSLRENIKVALDLELPASIIAQKLKIPICDVTAVYYADGYWLK